MTESPQRSAWCPLCGHGPATVFHQDGPRCYSRCDECQLVHLDRGLWPAPDDERQRYLLHRNDRTDAGYVRFLRRLADPVTERVDRSARGLDFGCGPVPVLAELLAERGFAMSRYDPLFHPDRAALAGSFDFTVVREQSG